MGLTDGVFWFIIYPFLAPVTYKLNFVSFLKAYGLISIYFYTPLFFECFSYTCLLQLNVSLHSINVVLLLIDVMLNRLVSC